MSSTQKEIKFIFLTAFFMTVFSIFHISVFADGPNDKFLPQQPKQYDTTPTSSTPTDNSKITTGTETNIKGASNYDTYSGNLKMGGTYFGGKISSMTSCSCNTDGSSQVVLRGPMGSSGTYLYVPANKTYARHMVNQGNYILGKYKSGGQCLIGAEPECTTLPISKGTINYVGTSF
jgi:hypothetical protein